MFDVAAIRNDFTILTRRVYDKPLIYLDNAATSQKPKQVIQSLIDFYTKHNANIHRGVHKLSQEATSMYEEAHNKVGSFVNAKHPFQETIFVKNATEGINMVAYAYPFKKGDEVICSVMEHHANLVPWQQLKSKGVVVKFVAILPDGRFDMDHYQSLLSDNTTLVAITHASNVTGVINPIKEIISLAHKKGALCLVDAAQSVPHMQVDMQDLDADFLVFSGHKMCAPTGTGALIAKTSILNKMHPFMTGGDMIKEVHLENSSWNDLPWKFEAGTPDIAGGIALGAAVDYLQQLGMENIRNHEVKLLTYALEKMQSIKGVEIYGPLDASKRTGLISFNITGIHPHDVASILDTEFGIAIRSGHHCAQPLTETLGHHSTNRVSFYFYNTTQEIDQLINGIQTIKKVFKK